eukprot:maker-scaffold60_size442463-snap-gene-0.19 protein:Tk12061 transcript:maker-scaffold60_size442463-snap-gene-0.19-mRNA-1 annotation:"hypothetical protein DAPPUDRAFT_190766"
MASPNQGLGPPSAAGRVVRLAHEFEATPEGEGQSEERLWTRTQDVWAEELKDKTFAHFQLGEKIQFGLSNAGFLRPSPVQWQALPVAHLGLDLVVQAKSGTGKTLVFVLTALEKVDLSLKSVQTLVLAPTREIAVQGARVALEVGAGLPGLKVNAFIGGTSLQDDVTKLKKCHMAVGSPGRIKQLIMEKYLKTDHVGLLVLDEADKLMSADFQSDLRWIFQRLPARPQVMALSATYPQDLEALVETFMHNPHHVRLGQEDQVLTGLSQFVYLVRAHPQVEKQTRHKMKALLDLLATVSFNQCLVFSNYSVRAEAMCRQATAQGWPALFIAATQDQAERLQAINSLKQFQCRVLFSTDLTARGIDAQNVDLVINVDVPWDSATYLHRIGRAGRFGSRALAVSLCPEEGTEMENLRKIVFRTGSKIAIIPKEEKNKKKEDDSEADFDLWTCDREPLSLLEPLECATDEEQDFYRAKQGKVKKRGGKSPTKTEDPGPTNLGWIEVPEVEKILNKPVVGINLLHQWHQRGEEDEEEEQEEYFEEEFDGEEDEAYASEPTEIQLRNAGTLLKSFFFANHKRETVQIPPESAHVTLEAMEKDIEHFQSGQAMTQRFTQSTIIPQEIPEQVQEAATLILAHSRGRFEAKADDAKARLSSVGVREALEIVKNRGHLPPLPGELESEQYYEHKESSETPISRDQWQSVPESVGNFDFPYALPHPNPNAVIPSGSEANNTGQWFLEWHRMVQENKQFIQDMEFFQQMQAVQGYVPEQ